MGARVSVRSTPRSTFHTEVTGRFEWREVHFFVGARSTFRWKILSKISTTESRVLSIPVHPNSPSRPPTLLAMACTGGSIAAKAGAVPVSRFDHRGKTRVAHVAGTARRALGGNVLKSSRRKSNCRAAIARVTHASSPTTASKGQTQRAEEFRHLADDGHNLIPLYRRIFDDQLTPILAYRCLVKEDERDAPSFLLESVVGGTQTGRFSFLGSRPYMEVMATQSKVTVLDHLRGTRVKTDEQDPITVAGKISEQWKPCKPHGLPECFAGGWVGYMGYDTVRYQYMGELPFEGAPEDDRGVPDLCLGLYRDVVVFDHATKQVFAVHWVDLNVFDGDVEAALMDGEESLNCLVKSLQPETVPQLPFGEVSMSLTAPPSPLTDSTMSKDEFLTAVAETKEHILAGDIFQLVLSHRFSRSTYADPFDVYRALRVVNPSPYMIYLQARGSIVVASSPEILCRTDKNRMVVNRPLAGTRMRGRTEAEDLELESDLLADEKEKAEHIMLVDLGRNDVGRVSKAGTVKVEKLMEVERYSHVMHISSTVTGSLLDDLGPWDVLRAALPVGTVSGAPKVRAMQIIDELEATRRGPYGGGVGYVGFMGEMDMALALRTMVVPTAHEENIYKLSNDMSSRAKREWTIHLQAGAGIVADSDPESEYQETVNKAAALARAIDLAEEAFTDE